VPPHAQSTLEELREPPAAESPEPLVAGIHLSLGEEVKMAKEILEVAEDVKGRIEMRRRAVLTNKRRAGRSYRLQE